MQIASVIMHPDKNRTPIEVQGKPGTLLVRSMFYTIQGEGPYAGRPAFFLRLAGCNLGAKTAFCQSCDTDFLPNRSKYLTYAEIMQEYINQLPLFPRMLVESRKVEGDQGFGNWAAHLPMLVVTGGEPSLHGDLPLFLEHFVNYFTKDVEGLNLASHSPEDRATMRGAYVPAMQIESNGYDLETLKRCQYVGAFIVISPKASHKGYVQTALEPMQVNGQSFVMAKNTASQNSMLEVGPDQACFKYVVSADPANAHHNLPKWVTDSARDPSINIYVSPCTVYARDYQGEVSSVWDQSLVNHAETSANYAYAAKLAQEFNLRLSVQMHTLTAIP